MHPYVLLLSTLSYVLLPLMCSYALLLPMPSSVLLLSTLGYVLLLLMRPYALLLPMHSDVLFHVDILFPGLPMAPGCRRVKDTLPVGGLVLIQTVVAM